MEADDNTGSWTSATNHEQIGGGLEKMFLDRNRRIKRAGARDGNKIGEVGEGIRLF